VLMSRRRESSDEARHEESLESISCSNDASLDSMDELRTLTSNWSTFTSDATWVDTLLMLTWMESNFASNADIILRSVIRISSMASLDDTTGLLSFIAGLVSLRGVLGSDDFGVSFVCVVTGVHLLADDVPCEECDVFVSGTALVAGTDSFLTGTFLMDGVGVFITLAYNSFGVVVARGSLFLSEEECKVGVIPKIQ